ncbi:MAG TPA: NAD(P)-binding domain-containing protein [Pseudomonadota bacterium]|jgi:predicted dinucleotide-binding enzyme|nr:NAD(P)-binding domain-containing protein [Pseudomonadota bacterium]
MKSIHNIAVLGSGQVGEVLANGFLKHGHPVMRGSRETSKLAEWQNKAGASAKVGSFAEAAAFGDVVVLCVKGTAAEEVVKSLGSLLDGKTVLDATNPIADAPPENGVIKFFTGPNESLMERLQAAAPNAHFVKAFSCVGNPFMVNPEFAGGKPSMFICGNNAEAKEQATKILHHFGWEVEDMGSATSARAIEPLCQLWCIPGFVRGSWAHAFKLLHK